MNQNVVLLIGTLVASISFSASAITTYVPPNNATCAALLAEPTPQAAIDRVLEKLFEADPAQFTADRDAEIEKHAAAYAQRVYAQEDVKKAELAQPYGTRPKRALRRAQKILQRARAAEAAAKANLENTLAQKFNGDVIMTTAVKTDAYFGKLVGNLEVNNALVEDAARSIARIETILSLFPRASWNPWTKMVSAFSRSKIESQKATLLRELKIIAKDAQFLRLSSLPEQMPTELETIAQYEALIEILTAMRDETLPTRDLLRAKVDETVRTITGGLRAEAERREAEAQRLDHEERLAAYRAHLIERGELSPEPEPETAVEAEADAVPSPDNDVTAVAPKAPRKRAPRKPKASKSPGALVTEESAAPAPATSPNDEVAPVEAAPAEAAPVKVTTKRAPRPRKSTKPTPPTE